MGDVEETGGVAGLAVDLVLVTGPGATGPAVLGPAVLIEVVRRLVADGSLEVCYWVSIGLLALRS